ncbi:MAG: hypothetical protein KIT77_25950 [Caldilinea sp.]|nr:hypothetical protein [Caldilineaceae bacterium]MCW5844722.1 hypothetical protein [Caldilinea sp.]
MTGWPRLTEEERRAILLVEALGLLHDVGKLTDYFLLDKCGGGTFSYQLVTDPQAVHSQVGALDDYASKTWQQWSRWRSAVTPYSSFPAIAETLAEATFRWGEESYSLAELPMFARPRPRIQNADWRSALGKTMRPALVVGAMHGIAHYEKEGGTKQTNYAAMCRASAFGDEQFINETAGATTLNDAYASLPVAALRDGATWERAAWLAVMRQKLELGIADTRRPTNEVTLWDWGYTVASLAKAALAWIAQNGWPDGGPGDIYFRTMSVTIDRLEIYRNTDKITDLLGLRDALDESYRKLQVLLEEEFGLGNRFYHDETGAYYLLPDIAFTEEDIARIRSCFPLDLLPHIDFGQPGDRIRARDLDQENTPHADLVERLLRLVAIPRKRAQEIAPPVFTDSGTAEQLHATWTAHGARPKNAERCAACGLRPVAYPDDDAALEAGVTLAGRADGDTARDRHLCRVCLDRRGRPARDWYRDRRRTVWTDEVADDNGRLALFVGALDLDGWLDASLISTLVVSEENGRPKEAKNPSPARIYRIAETARSFWSETVAGLDGVIGQPLYRIAIQPSPADVAALNDDAGLLRYHAYEINVDGVLLAVMWDGERFVTTENLAYFVSRWKPEAADGEGDDPFPLLRNSLNGSRFEVMEPAGYDEISTPRAAFRVQETERLEAFTPVIDLMTEPSLCMTLVPADKAMAVANWVKGRYEKQMGRVRDRLPMHMGLVFFPRRTPIRSVLDAGRRMLGMAGEWLWQAWTVDSVAAAPSGVQRVTFDNGVCWDVPTKALDGTDDRWYPYFLSAAPATPTATIGLTDLCHVTDLAAGSKVFVRPSRFDYEFLDTTGRTYDIAYDPATGRRLSRPTRPYPLEHLETLDKVWDDFQTLSRSQRYQVVQAIEATSDEWNLDFAARGASSVFGQFVADTLAGAAWPKGKKWHQLSKPDRSRLVDAGIRGDLTDVVEIHMQILKEREPAANQAPVSEQQ